MEIVVTDAVPKDVGKGFARVSPGTLEKLNVQDTAPVMLVSDDARMAVRLVEMEMPDGYICVDGPSRTQLKVRLNDTIKIEKAKSASCNEIKLSPVDNSKLVNASGLLHTVMQGMVLTRDQIIRVKFPHMPRDFYFVVDGYSPARKIVQIVPETDFIISPEPTPRRKARVRPAYYHDIGGLHEEVMRVREVVERPLFYPEMYLRLGIEPPRGVLLHGQPGCGKTLIGRAVATESCVHFISLSATEIISPVPGETEAILGALFKEARACAPTIIFIDEIDTLATKRDDNVDETAKRACSALLSEMDGMKSREQVIIIGSTNRANSLDDAVRRPGRFDREIVIGVPDAKGRREILQIHTRAMPLEGVDLNNLVDMTQGYVGADLAALTREAAMAAVRKEFGDEYDLDGRDLGNLLINMDDFEVAQSEVGPSALRDATVETPNVSWTDVGGLDEAKQQIQEIVEYPLKYPNLMAHMGVKPPSGLLLWGPPGTGKTLMAKAAANECGANFISVAGPSLLSKWVGETERNIREIFSKARKAAPCIIFFDEFDSLAIERGTMSNARWYDQMVSQLLVEMDGITPNDQVTIIAATNRPELIDPALVRGGRLELRVEVPIPDLKAREEIFKIHTRGVPLDETIAVEALATRTDGYTGADIETIIKEATMLAVREFIKKGGNDSKVDTVRIGIHHIEQAIDKCKPIYKSSKTHSSCAKQTTTYF